jgi:hypothetical protein
MISTNRASVRLSNSLPWQRFRRCQHPDRLQVHRRRTENAAQHLSGLLVARSGNTPLAMRARRRPNASGRRASLRRSTQWDRAVGCLENLRPLVDETCRGNRTRRPVHRLPRPSRHRLSGNPVMQLRRRRRRCYRDDKPICQGPQAAAREIMLTPNPATAP